MVTSKSSFTVQRDPVRMSVLAGLYFIRLTYTKNEGYPELLRFVLKEWKVASDRTGMKFKCSAHPERIFDCKPASALCPTINK